MVSPFSDAGCRSAHRQSSEAIKGNLRGFGDSDRLGCNSIVHGDIQADNTRQTGQIRVKTAKNEQKHERFCEEKGYHYGIDPAQISLTVFVVLPQNPNRSHQEPQEANYSPDSERDDD